MLKVLIVVAIIFSIGLCTGFAMKPSTHERVEFIKVPHTVIVTETAKPEPAPPAVLDDTCLTAIRHADAITRHAEDIYDSGTSQIAIISDARIALYDMNATELQAIQTRQNRLHGTTVNDLALIEEALLAMKSTMQTCKESQ